MNESPGGPNHQVPVPRLDSVGMKVAQKVSSLVTLADIAERIGVSVDSMRVYHQRAVKNRRETERAQAAAELREAGATWEVVADELAYATPEDASEAVAYLRANRPAGFVRPGDLPPPDVTFGRTPVWDDRTIARWADARPGRGVGGGRPRHKNVNEGKQ